MAAPPRVLVNKCAGLLVIVLICTALIMITGSGSDNVNSGITQAEALVRTATITTEDVVAGQYYGKGGNASWAGEKTLSFLSRSGDLVTYNTSSGGKNIVVKGNQFITRPWKTYLSRDGATVLVSFSPQRIFRSTILARYAVHDATTGSLVKELKTSDHEDGEPQAFQLGVWSNDNKLVFLVYKNDLYAADARGNVVQQLTQDGSDAIFNGIADWVFEEEIFVSTSTAVYSSASGMYVGYLKFNDTVVEPITYNLYGDYSGEPYFDEYYQYPKFGTVRYPKSGRRNPTVSIHVVKIGDPICWKTVLLTHNPTCTWDLNLNSLMTSLTNLQDNFIVGQLQWLDSIEHTFSLLVFNRIQNRTWIIECSFSTRNCKIIRTTNQNNGWIDNAKLHVYNNQYVTLASVPQSDGLEYMHAVGYTNEYVRMHTNGYYSVDEIVQINEIGGKNVIVFKAPLLRVDKDTGHVTIEDASQAHYYGIEISGSDNVPVCLTCYGDCTFNSAKFSGSQFVNTCEKKHGVSNVQVVGINEDLSVKVIETLEANERLALALAGVALPEGDYLVVPYSVGGKSYNMSVKVIGPVGWRAQANRKFPVIVDTYSGPNSQKVTKRFTPNDWSYSLASNANHPVVYVIIDGIGSGRQSSSLAFEVYRDLGNKEIHDKIYALKYLLDKYKSLDPTRTLIWGWSYGGYVSSMMMGKDTERVFKCGISVAPVTNWYYYDTMYTERYMSTPQDNPEGYNRSSVLRYTDNFKGKPYLLVHGNADDNVHYQQSMVLSRSLEQKSILFRMQSYPDENHSLGGVRSHLFKTLENFVFNECFRKQD